MLQTVFFFYTFWRPKKYQKGLDAKNSLRLPAALKQLSVNKESFA
jgi:hypothetical protein